MFRSRAIGTRLAAVAAAITISGTAASCSTSPAKPTAAQTLASFMSAWDTSNGPAMSALLTAPDPALPGQIRSAIAGLHSTSVQHHALLDTPPGEPPGQAPTGNTATATVSSTYLLPAAGPWKVTSTLTLQKVSGRWKISWAPSAIYPSMPAGGHLDLSYQWAPRAAILGAGNTALTSDQPQVVVGVEGSRIKSSAQVTAVLGAAGATASEISLALAQATAHPDYFSTVFTLTQAAYDALGGDASPLHTTPGTVFSHVTERRAATSGLADHLVGTVGPPTAQQLSALGPAYSVSTPVGHNGLEAFYQNQLAGTPGATVTVTAASGSTVSSVVVTTPVAGTPVTTSIDLTVQQAAEAALAAEAAAKKLSTGDGIAALVAVQVSTGKILASTGLPAGGGSAGAGGFDYALQGEFPPGSTFKILTSTALMDAGLTPSSPASCPPTATVDGEVFHNAEGDSPISNLAQAFTESCNTAFIGLATSHLQPSSLTGVASLYGLGAKIGMGYPAFAGSVPKPSDAAGLAATSIGQSAVVVSPLNMAEVAAAVGAGTFHPARLVQGAPDDTATGNLVPASTVASLRQMMASVVASGTAANTGLPAGTYAKTGTAEYGTGKTLPLDAWLVGYHGDVAFAMVQHDSKLDGGPADGPVVAKFLAALPASVLAGGQ